MAKSIIEWKIENFSCWCEAVHGKSIKSPDITGFCPIYNVELYPKGDSGQDDHMDVSFCNYTGNFIGDLAFVCSDGSSIFSQEVNFPQTSALVNLKFEEVVTQLKKADQKDDITLRFNIESDNENEQRMCTTIGVWKVSYKIDPKLFESKGSKDILYFRYSNVKDGLFLKINRQDEKVKLIIYRKTKAKAIMVESSSRILSSDGDLVRNEVVKHVFIESEEWVVSDSFKVKELEEKGITIILGLRVINGEIVERYNYNVKDKKVSIVPNSSDYFCQQPNSQSEDSSTAELKKDLMSLYQDQKFSDFQLKCGDVTFPVHKNVLSARTPVLDRMLSTDMTEATSGEVVIEDLDPSTLSLFLAFLYTGTVEDLDSDRALKLYYAADKYQVPSLKRECCDFLRSNVTIANVCDILSLADKHKEDGLTAVSHDFILSNYSSVLRSKEWVAFMEREPFLGVKTLTLFGQKNLLQNAISLS